MNRNSGFFNRLLPSPRPSLAARAVPVPQGEGAYWLFSRFSVSYTSIRKNAVLQDFEQALRNSPCNPTATTITAALAVFYTGHGACFCADVSDGAHLKLNKKSGLLPAFHLKNQ